MTEPDIARLLMVGGAVLPAAVGLPAILRRASCLLRLAIARACGRMRPFGGRACIIDGDTILVQGIRVRLFGMDAPEMDQQGGPEARRHLLRLIDACSVEIFPRDTDVYGRTVARVFRGRRDLGRAMVRDGYARAMPYWSWRYLAEEARARLGRCGLWASSRVNGIGDPAHHRAARKGLRPRRQRR